MERNKETVKTVRSLLATAIVLIGFSGAPCMADFIWMDPGDILSDTLTVDAGTIIAGGSWGSGTEFSYEVSRPLDPTEPLHYSYTFTASGAPALSHFILQVSEAVIGGLAGFDPDNPLDYIDGPTVADDPMLYLPGGGDNPGMPAGGLWGIKFEDGMPLWTIEFDSFRLPMDGSFYAKGGSESYAYNSGLEFPDTGAFILVPDTKYVPVPGAVLLGILGLGAVGIKLRKNA